VLLTSGINANILKTVNLDEHFVSKEKTTINDPITGDIHYSNKLTPTMSIVFDTPTICSSRDDCINKLCVINNHTSVAWVAFRVTAEINIDTLNSHN
jgi:hypothetical protein